MGQNQSAPRASESGSPIADIGTFSGGAAGSPQDISLRNPSTSAAIASPRNISLRTVRPVFASSALESPRDNSFSSEGTPTSASLYGVVNVQISSIANNRNRHMQEDTVVKIGGKRGTLFSGSNCNTALISQSMEDLNLNRPRDFNLGDSRASQLLITYIDGWYAIPSPEVFSRHSSTCLVVGDKNYQGSPYALKLGECFRLGSVGLVVSEIKYPNGQELRLNSRTLQYLRDDALNIDDNDDDAMLASQESRIKKVDMLYEEDSADGVAPLCYMCYETTETKENPMVAPCDCRGDTRYLHVACLQKWYQSSVSSLHAQVIRTVGNGAPACKICGSAYKTTFRDASGKRLSLLETDDSIPYMSLLVVTKHDTNPSLFNTKFRLNFGRSSVGLRNEPNALSSLTIGRSSSCNMILDYRTVSTVHAKIEFENGQFLLTDNSSSNGTMIYVREPIALPYSRQFRFRMGRCTLNIQAKRSWISTLRGTFSRSTNGFQKANPSNGRAPPQTSTELFEKMSAIVADYNVRVSAVLAKNNYAFERRATEGMPEEDDLVNALAVGTATSSPTTRYEQPFVVENASYFEEEEERQRLSGFSNPPSPRRVENFESSYTNVSSPEIGMEAPLSPRTLSPAAQRVLQIIRDSALAHAQTIDSPSDQDVESRLAPASPQTRSPRVQRIIGLIRDASALPSRQEEDNIIEDAPTSSRVPSPRVQRVLEFLRDFNNSTTQDADSVYQAQSFVTNSVISPSGLALPSSRDDSDNGLDGGSIACQEGDSGSP